jgi:hypothetical protein
MMLTQKLMQVDGGLSCVSRLDPRFHGSAHRVGGSWHYRVHNGDVNLAIACGWLKAPKGAMKNILHKVVEEFAHRAKKAKGGKA